MGRADRPVPTYHQRGPHMEITTSSAVTTAQATYDEDVKALAQHQREKASEAVLAADRATIQADQLALAAAKAAAAGSLDVTV